MFRSTGSMKFYSSSVIMLSIVVIFCLLVTTVSFNFAPSSRHVPKTNYEYKAFMTNSDNDAEQNDEWSSKPNPMAG